MSLFSDAWPWRCDHDVNVQRLIQDYSTAQNKDVLSYQHVDGLDDIDKDLVLLVFDALGPPGDGVGHGGRHLALGHLQFGAFLRDVPAGGSQRLSVDVHACLPSGTGGRSLLQDLAVSSLREPKVHQFIQQLVDNHKVVLDALLLQLLEVLSENLNTQQVSERESDREKEREREGETHLH